MRQDKDTRAGRRRTRRLLGLVAAAGAAVACMTACSTPAQSTAAAAPVQVTVPPYYVALVGSQPEYEQGSPPADVAVVRATTTGAVLARIRPPRYYTFATVTGAADDSTFVLYGVGPTGAGTLTYGTYRQRLFLLHIDPAAATPSARAQLTALPEADIPGGQGRQLLAMALSPDGKSLAAIISRSAATIPYGQSVLTIFDLASGTQRTWTRNVCVRGRCVAASIGDGYPLIQYPSRVQLSWTADGRSLVFIEGPTGSQVRLLHVDARGASLMADSRALPTRPGVILWSDAVITPNGKTVLIEYSSGAATVVFNLLRFSAATGRPSIINRAVYFTAGHATGAGPDSVLWTNNDGSKIIVLGSQPGLKTGGLHGHTFTPTPAGQTAGVYTGTRYTPLPWPANVIDAAW